MTDKELGEYANDVPPGQQDPNAHKRAFIDEYKALCLKHKMYVRFDTIDEGYFVQMMPRDKVIERYVKAIESRPNMGNYNL